MKVILLERVERLGSIGDVVSVKDGFARNFLLPRSKALRASSTNLSISPDAQPSKGDGCAGISATSAASNADRISPAMRGGPSMTT